jgi:hypothetical protein
MRTEAEKQSRRKYLATPKGKAMAARSWAKYRASEKWRQANRQGQKRYSQTLNGKRNAIKGVQKHNRAHPDRYRARTAVSNALKSGLLARKPCEICGEPAQAHHEDYSRPLDVRWRCFEHHLNEHNKRKVKLCLR